MNYLDLSWFVDQHLEQRERHHVLHVKELTEELYNKLTPDQRRVIDRERLKNRVMEIGIARGATLSW